MHFVEPETLNEALNLLSVDPDGTKIVAGGTALVLMLQQHLITPETLLSLGRIPDLDAISQDEKGVVHIGPMALLRDVAQSLLIMRQFPGLAQACGVVGNVRVRNQATLGGNLAEADYASDPPTMLLAMDAWVTATNVRSDRDIDIADLIMGFYTTALDPDELIGGIHIPPPPSNARMAYLKYRSRSSEDRPCAGVAVVAGFEGDMCSELRVAVGAACEVPRRLPKMEKLAQGEKLTDELIAEIAEGYAAKIDTLDDLRGSSLYRTQMIRVHVRRALEGLRDGHR